MARDKARVTTHKLHDRARLRTGRRLDEAITDHRACGGYGRVEAEGLVEEEDVIVDALRHADDRA